MPKKQRRDRNKKKFQKSQGSESPKGRRKSSKSNENFEASSNQKRGPRRGHSPHKLVEGYVKRNPDGFGFLIPDDSEIPDIYIPRHSMTGVMTNDRLVVSVKNYKGDRLSGEVVEVTKHSATQVVGLVHTQNKTKGVVIDEESIWGENLKVTIPPELNIEKDSLVLITITDYPGSAKGFSGVAKQILGSELDPQTDTKRMLFSHHIPLEFSSESLKEADQLPEKVETKNLGHRKDLRDKKFITIDGATAKDFDDAIYVEKHHDGFLLWVGIADVSHYVKHNSALDEEAYERGNSSYFPHFVAPMLPEALSNELCSLKPHVPRFAFVAEMKIDHEGNVVDKKFYEAVIESCHRVTYGQAEEVIDGINITELFDVKDMILTAADLAKILMKRRFQEGSLDLNIPETQVLIDDAGNPTDIIRTERLFAHRLIEEMMLITNVSVAKFLHEKHAPCVHRIHEEPAEENLSNLERYITNFGGQESALRGGKLQKKISMALENFANRPEAEVINILTLRSLKQAQYSHEAKGHFGLGFQHYVHFTSPIRRYADLIVHRQLKSVLYKKEYKAISEEELSTYGAHLSSCEQRSVKAERQLQAIKKARFMSRYLGKEFEGIISSVTKFGVFVLLRSFDVDGLIRLEQLGHEKWEFDEELLQLVGKRSGFRYKIGDHVTVSVVRTDTDQGQIDFSLVSQDAQAPTPTTKNQNPPSNQKQYGEIVPIKTFDPSRFDSTSTDKVGFGQKKKKQVRRK